jgi:hypothetical protein
MLMVHRQSSFYPTLLFIFLALLLGGCAGAQTTTQNLVTTEYFLQQAGFQKWAVNDTTPKRQALLNNIPRGKITTFEKGGVTYHAYTDENAQRLYIGDDAAYQKYVSISQGRKLCERVTAPDSSQFWSCYDEYQKRGGR